MKLIVGIVLCIGYLGISHARIGDGVVQTIVQPDKAEYRANAHGSDKHKFGYELGENQHFHHTTTDEDGVRLGCYGHVLEGKKYSTQYVADLRGYRMVNTDALITVYPKSGGERKASFTREFNENELLSRNIRFFFPDGCNKKQPDLAVAESRQEPVYVAPPTTKTTQRPRLDPITTEAPYIEPLCPKPKCVCTCSYDEL